MRVSFKICKLKLCNGSFRARLPSKSARRCENEKRSFRARLPSKTALCRGRFFAVIALLQSLFSCSHLSLRSFLFAVIVLCSHCALPSLCFAVMVLCSHGSLQCWNRMQQRDQQKDFLSRKYKHETVRGQGCSLVHIQAAAYHRAREDLGSLCANPCVFKFPNSKFQTLFLFLVPILLPIPIT